MADLHLIWPRNLFERVMHELDRRGRGRHEAGAFLLGHEEEGVRRIADVVHYDDLDPRAYDTGICVLHGDSFGKLWSACRERRMTVVADAHTHRRAAHQSRSDRENPMVACAGHVAVIVPDFARGPVLPERLGLYAYLGDHRWTNHSGRDWEQFLSLPDNEP